MPSPTDRIKIIQVGAGAMGRLWLDVLAGSADVELVGLVDIDLSAAQLSAAGAGLPNVALARSLPELLDLVAADAVLNVTVPEAHAEVSITALLHGLAVLCEKPLADTLAAALSMIAAAEVGGRLLMVSQSRRYWRNLDALRASDRPAGPARARPVQLLQGAALRRLSRGDGVSAARRTWRSTNSIWPAS